MDTLSGDLEDLCLDGYHNYIRFNVGGREFQAHIRFFAVRSLAFARMLKNEMAENPSGVVEVADCDGDSFGDFLLFFHSGGVRHLTFSNAVNLYKLTEKYNLKDLNEICISYLTETMSIDMVCDAIALEVFYTERELLKTPTKAFTDKLLRMFATEEWIAFTKEHPELVYHLFGKYITGCEFVRSSKMEQHIKNIFRSLIEQL